MSISQFYPESRNSGVPLRKSYCKAMKKISCFNYENKLTFFPLGHNLLEICHRKGIVERIITEV